QSIHEGSKVTRLLKRCSWCKLIVTAMVLSIVTAGIFAGRRRYMGRPGYGLPYYARFTPDEDDRWNAFGGAWDVIDGSSMRNYSNDRGAKLLTGSAKWKDYTVEGDIQLVGSGSSGFIARVNEAESGENSFKGYYAALRKLDNSLVLAAFDFAYHE